MLGDYARFQPIYGMSILDIDTPVVQPILITAKGAARRICVQRLVFVPSVYTACVIAFLDSLTMLSVGNLSIPAFNPSTSGETNSFSLDFGPTGTMLSAGANLLLAAVPGCASGRLHIEAYQKGPLPGPGTYTAPTTAGVTA